MTVRLASIMAAGLTLLVFSTPTPAPQVPNTLQDPLNETQAPDAAPAPLATLVALGSVQTDAIHALDARMKALDQRITALEKKKENDHGR